jgi:HSP20 family molecular chaperone IbpA
MMNKYYDSMLKSDNLFQTLRILDDICSPTLTTRQRYFTSTAAAKTEVKDNELHLSVDLPGVKPNDLSVQAEGRTIKIVGKRKGEEIKHAYTLSKEYDPETTSALLEDGVLTLTFEKTASESSRRIEVKVK